MAIHQVKDTILFTAFNSTDFAHKPHLSPKLEGVETKYEVALLSNDARAKEMEREKELSGQRSMMMRIRFNEIVTLGHDCQ